MNIWHGVMEDEEKLSRCKINTDIVYDTLKTHTKYADTVRGRPTLKDVIRSVREPYERSLYERTFMSVPFNEEHDISTDLTNVSREKHTRKSPRVCRRDREPSRIPIRNLKSLGNKSRKVRIFAYARILSSIIYNVKKLLNKRTFNCRERIRHSTRKVRYHASRYLTLFSFHKLILFVQECGTCSKLLQR